MRAILIDPTPLADPQTADPDQMVREVEYTGDIQTIYEMLSFPGQKVCSFECIRAKGIKDGIYVDEHGLLHDPKYWFAIWDHKTPLAGRGLILGTGPEGAETSCDISLDEIRARLLLGHRKVDWKEDKGIMHHDKDIPHIWIEKYPWVDRGFTDIFYM